MCSLDYLSKLLKQRLERVDAQTAEWFTEKLDELNACRAAILLEKVCFCRSEQIADRRHVRHATCISRT